VPQSGQRITSRTSHHGIIIIFLPWMGAKYCDEFFCLSVRSHIKFLCMLPVAVARSSSDSVAICYVLPVLWVTDVMFSRTGPMARHVMIEYDKLLPNSRDSNQIAFHEQLLVVSCTLGRSLLSMIFLF